MYKFLLFASLFLFNTALAQQKPSGVYYEIFVRSFHDSNQDGIGDINGITQKLDYLQNLGISGLWLTPIHPSPTYHKYDVLNYQEIDSEYGTLADYRNLVKEAHKRNIKVLLDFVVNHTSSEHPWFKAACNNHPIYRDYYVWSDTAKTMGWYGNPKNPQDKYYAFFWERMPDLNFDNPAVRRDVINAGAFWMKEIGIDGFRLDAAQHVYEPNDVILNNKWWSEFRTAMKKINPNAFIVGEVWNKDSIVATYLRSSLDASFNFDLSIAINQAIKDTNATGFIDRLIQIHQLYQSFNPNFVDAIFVSNHDQDRYRSTFGGDMPKTKQAFTILMTLPGIPFIYYGEELGMLGKFPDEYRREPMLWNESGSGNTTWEKPRYTSVNTVDPLHKQAQDSSSFYTYYKKMIALRNSYPVLSQGTLVHTSLITNTKQLIAYELHHQQQKALIIHNIGNHPVKVNLPKYKQILFGNSQNQISSNSSLILLIK